jgi:hypothetical protein
MPKWPNHNGRESAPLLGISSSILFWSESVPNRGEKKEGAFLSVGGCGSISQGWRRVGGVYYRGGEEGEHIYGDEEKEGDYLSVGGRGSISQE